MKPLCVFACILFLLASAPARAQDGVNLLPAKELPSASSQLQQQQARHFELSPMENCKTSLEIEAHRKGQPLDSAEMEKECLRRTKGEEPDGKQKLYSVCRKLDIYAEFLICMGDKTLELPPQAETPKSGLLPPAPDEQMHYKRLDPQLKKTTK